jgi:hypothetical protein
LIDFLLIAGALLEIAGVGVVLFEFRVFSGLAREYESGLQKAAGQEGRRTSRLRRICVHARALRLIDGG